MFDYDYPDPSEDRAVTARSELAALLRQAAGMSASDWIMTDSQERRDAVRSDGLGRLVEAAGSSMAAWLELDEFSRERAGILLRGARQLGIATEWKGWQ